MKRPPLAILAALLLLLAFGACNERIAERDQEEALSERFDDGGAVEVQLAGYQINMPTSVPAGPTTFQITNAGDMPHSFEVEGQGIEAKLDNPLPPGGTGTLQVDLQPGRYKVYCPVADHEEKGMSMPLVVTPPAS